MGMNWWETLAALDKNAASEAALEHLAALAAQNPDDLGMRIELAQRYRAAGHFSYAIGTAMALTRQGDAHQKFRAHLELAACFEALNDTQGAALALMQARELDPGSHWPATGLARLLNDPDQVIAHYPALRPDAKAEAARYLAGLRARNAYGAARAEAGWRVHPPLEIPALADAVLLMMVKDEEDIIGQNLAHHYALGFRRFCIIDNASTDQTPDIIAKFRNTHPQARVAVINDAVTGYYQSGKIIAAARFCEVYMALEAAPPRWYFCLDADEFITFTSNDITAAAASFNQALASTDHNLCVMHWIHCSSEPMYKSIPLDANPFQYFNKLATALDPAVPKISYRPDQGLEPMEGYHFVPHYDYELSRIIHAADFGIYLMHFSLRTWNHVQRKVINGGLAYEAAKNMDIHGGHWRERYRLYKLHGDTIITQILANHIREIK